MIASWPGPGGDEYALVFDRSRSRRVLVCPALFDESNKLRRFIVEVMRRLDGSGIDSFLPDLPGCNESLVPLHEQALDGWRGATAAAAGHFGVTHVLTIRAGALLAPDTLPGWRYAAIGGAAPLRSLLRARVLSAREAGHEENRETLLEQGRAAGLDLAGYRLGAAMVTALADADLAPSAIQREIGQADVGGAGLWLRSEPDFEARQADALAAIVAMELLA